MFIYFKRMVFSRESASEDYANVSVNFLPPDIDPTVMCHSKVKSNYSEYG